MKPPTPPEDTHSAEDRFKKQIDEYNKVKTPRFRLSNKEGSNSSPPPQDQARNPADEIVKTKLISVAEEPEEKKED